jgi:acetyl esterase/lipase
MKLVDLFGGPTVKRTKGAVVAFVLAIGFAASMALAQATAEPKPINLWPGTAPGEKGGIGLEHDTTKNDPPGKRVIRLGFVSVPTLTVFRPTENANGAAVIVCPGGGYSILAYDLEGTEICKWLNSVGVTGVLLKYRVPSRVGLSKHQAAFQDAQRTIALVREHAREWEIDPRRLGILGFSAGGHLAAFTSTNYEKRSYDKVDSADEQSLRPDFTVLIYPAYLSTAKGEIQLVDEMPVNKHTPPAFLVMAEDDPLGPQNAMAYFDALAKAKVRAELHVYPSGGHGYGLRPSPNQVTTWPERAADWMKSEGLLSQK